LRDMAKVSIDFVKNVFRLLRADLASLGFEKRTRGILTITVSSDVLGWLGLNIATRGQKDFIEINPVIGVRNQRIEKLIADILGERFDEVIPPTLTKSIGYLTPENRYISYNFSSQNPPDPVVASLIASVGKFGLPFIERHVEMATLVNSLRTGKFSIPFMVAYRVPAGLYLLGQNKDAISYLNAELVKIGDRDDPAATRFKSFARKFAEVCREH